MHISPSGSDPVRRSVFLGLAKLLSFVALSGTAIRVCAQDWPGWRGADRSDRSTETGLLQEWPEGGPTKLWTNDRCGLGYAGFSIVGNRLFTMGLEDNSEFALCLDAGSGQELWRTTIGERFENGWGDGPRSTPTVDGDRVYFLAAKGTLTCLKADSGESIWSRNLTDFGGRIPDWGYSESPLVDGPRVVCTPGGPQGAILALDKLTGDVIWQTSGLDVNAHYSSIIRMKFGGVDQYVQLLVNRVVGVLPESGKVAWEVEFPGRIAVIPTPVDVDGRVYVTAGYNAGSILVEPDGFNGARQAWQGRNAKNHHGGMILVDGFIYGHSDSTGFVCQDMTDGKLKWNNREIGKGCVAWADGRFYYVEEDSGDVLLIEASPEKISLHGRFTMQPQTQRRSPQGRIWVHPVIAGGRLFVRDQEFIHCYDIRR